MHTSLGFDLERTPLFTDVLILINRFSFLVIYTILNGSIVRVLHHALFSGTCSEAHCACSKFWLLGHLRIKIHILCLFLVKFDIWIATIQIHDEEDEDGDEMTIYF